MSFLNFDYLMTHYLYPRTYLTLVYHYKLKCQTVKPPGKEFFQVTLFSDVVAI
jgi:hypothetical protein